jgi:hypothetical protein
MESPADYTMNDRGIKFGRRSAFFVRVPVMVSLLVSSIAAAADDVRVETVLSDLRGPSGIAIRQVPGVESYEIFVAEAGAGRIVRLSSDKPDAGEEAITGFIASTDDDDLVRLPGPHGLLFLDPNRLVVAGSEGEDRPFVRLYELSDAKKPMTAEQHETQAAPTTGEEGSDDNVASFHSVARTLANDKVPDFLVLSAINKNRTANLWRLTVRSGTIGELSPLGKDGPVASSMAIAVEPRGYIVVVRPDERDESSISRMEFVNPMDGRSVVKVPIKLAGIAGVAYSPRSGNLFAISHSSRGSNRSGIYRIDLDESSGASELSANATFVAEVQRPTALAFGPDGGLYVTSLGNDRRGGSLQKISDGL